MISHNSPNEKIIVNHKVPLHRSVYLALFPLSFDNVNVLVIYMPIYLNNIDLIQLSNQFKEPSQNLFTATITTIFNISDKSDTNKQVLRLNVNRLMNLFLVRLLDVL